MKSSELLARPIVECVLRKGPQDVCEIVLEGAASAPLDMLGPTPVQSFEWMPDSGVVKTDSGVG